jgi:hypothetical protein
MGRRIAQRRFQPVDPGPRLGDGHLAGGIERPMSRHGALVGHLFQHGEAFAPAGQIGGGRGGRAVMEQQVAADQHARPLIENGQIRRAVPRQRQEPQHPPAKDLAIRGQRHARHHQIGPPHPVAQQAIHLIGKTLSVSGHVGNCARQGGDDAGRKGADAHAVVGMQMGDIDADHRLPGHLLGHGLQGMAIAQRGAAIDQHRARPGGDDGDVGDGAAIGGPDRFIGTRNHPEPVADGKGPDGVSRPGAQSGGGKRGHAGQNGSARQDHDAASTGTWPV